MLTGDFNVIPEPRDAGPAPVVDPTAAMTAVEQVSVAFVDAFAHNDDIARGWLSERASVWLKGVGELRRGGSTR